MTAPVNVTEFPLWSEAPFRDKISSRYEIRKGEFQGRPLVVVWDPEYRVWAGGPIDGWTDQVLENVMNNLAGATFTQLKGHQGYVRVLEAKKIAPRARSPEAQHLIDLYDRLYAWGPDSGAAPLASSA